MNLREVSEIYHGKFDNFVSTIYYDENDIRIIEIIIRLINHII